MITVVSLGLYSPLFGALHLLGGGEAKEAVEMNLQANLWTYHELIYSYKATVKTSNDVSVVTFSDID